MSRKRKYDDDGYGDEHENDDEEKVWGRVLSIQSHTVHGYVGNKSAVFPLQLLGFEVDPINSVQFSNHTGYVNGFTGEVLTGPELDDLVLGLEKNNLLLKYSCVLTGYIGSASFLRCVLKLVEKLRSRAKATNSSSNDKFRYFCDPVMGDNGKLYVPKELVEIYKKEVIPHVSVLTPNQFELELLTDMKITSLSDAKVAFEKLHNQGVDAIILTSSNISVNTNTDENRKPSVVSSSDNDHTDAPGSRNYLIASYKRLSTETSQVGNKIYVASFPVIPGHYTGTGDLISALLLAWTTRLDDDLSLAIRKALATMQSVLKRTHEAKEKGLNETGELLLIQSKKSIETPNIGGHDVIVAEIQ